MRVTKRMKNDTVEVTKKGIVIFMFLLFKWQEHDTTIEI